MKKITFLLTFLFMFAGTGVTRAQSDLVSATPTDGTFAADTKWYTIKSANGNYIATNGNYVDGLGNLKLVGTAPTDIYGYWCLTGDATNGYELRNAAFPATMVLGMTGSEAAARSNLYYADETDNGVTKRFDLTAATSTNGTSGYNIKLHGSANNGFNNRDGYLALWNSTGISTDNGSTYVFEPVTSVTPNVEKLRVNYIITDSHTSYTGKTCAIVAAGSTAAVPELSYFYGTPGFSETDLAITAVNHNFTMTISSESAPFEFSTPENPKWYTMKTRNDDTRYIVRIADDNIAAGGAANVNPGNTPFDETYISTFDKLEGAMWAFVQDGGGVKLYNRKGLKYVTTAGIDADASLTDNGTTYIANTTSNGNFSLRQPGSTGSYIGSHRDTNSKLGTWSGGNNTNGGSSFTIATIDETPNALTIARTIYKNVKSSEYNGTYDSYIGDVAAETENKANSAENVETVMTLKDTPLSLNLVGTDKYFRIVFKRGSAAMTNMYATISGENEESVNNSIQAAWADADGEITGNGTTDNQRAVTVNPDNTENDMSAIWQFEAIPGETGKYYIKNVNTGFYLGQAQKGNKTDAGHLHLLARNTDLQYAGNYSIVTNSSTPTEKAICDNNITANEKYLNTYYNTPNNYGRGIGLWSDATTDAGNVIYLYEVTEIPVNISAAGYSTLNLPFAVNIPAGVTAYTVTGVNNQELAMQPLTDVIPANTAVILQANQGEYNFGIAPAAETVTGNILTGTTLERHGMEAGSYYGLANKTQGVAFYVANSTEAPANKAILKKSDIPASTSLANALTFSGETTGIGNIETEDSADGSNVYYNLNGVRVLYPSHGIYVKGNGQKVFIK